MLKTENPSHIPGAQQSPAHSCQWQHHTACWNPNRQYTTWPRRRNPHQQDTPSPQPAPLIRATPSMPQHAMPPPPPNAQVPSPLQDPETSAYLRGALNKCQVRMECVSASNKQLEDLKNEKLQLKVELTRLQGELKASNLLLEERSNELAIELSVRTKFEATELTQNNDPQGYLNSDLITWIFAAVPNSWKAWV